MSNSFAFPPRLMSEHTAAYYLGISPAKLRTADIPRKVDGGRRLYDVRDLDARADELAYDRDMADAEAANAAADDAFGGRA